MSNSFDLITAIITPYGTSGISVIRVSGSGAIKQVNKIFKGTDLNQVLTHTVNYGHIIDEKGLVIDEVLVSVLRAPRTFTKEETVEISTHGGILITEKVLERILSIGIRMAEPGEFTKRAFLNGRIDLIEAESVMDLITATNENALKVSHKGLQKQTSRLISNLRSDLIEIIAQIEVNIDYPEYDDAEEMTKEIVMPRLHRLIDEMNDLVRYSNNNRLVKEGIDTIIVGRPNVGKSSLLNALLDEDKAIVTNIPGTTRDIIEASINLDGIILNLIDTAGIRKTQNVVEEIGIKKTLAALDKAELVLVVIDSQEALTQEDQDILRLTKSHLRIIVYNKEDIMSKEIVRLPNSILLSSLKRTNLSALTNKIKEIVNYEKLVQNDFNYLSNARHISKMNEALKALEEAKVSLVQGLPVDFTVIDITNAWNLLGEITGEKYQDGLLDELFSKFCLGK